MGALNATGWLLVMSASSSADDLFDFASELFERVEAHHPDLRNGPQLHGFPPEMRERGMPRYCLHPTGEPHPEVRGDDLADVMMRGCLVLTKLLPDHEMWRRD